MSKVFHPAKSCCARVVLFLGLALSVSQPAHGQEYTAWKLVEGTPHGFVLYSHAYKTQVGVHHIDAEGGSASMQVWARKKPECVAVFQFSWSFSQPLTVIRNGDIIEAKSELSANPSGGCHPPLDAKMVLRPSKGASYSPKLVGKMNAHEQEVILWHPKVPNDVGRLYLDGRRGKVSDGVVNQLRVFNKYGNSPAKPNTNKAVFTVQMEYRGAVYDIYYVFKAA